jgi:hypothetical protein
MINGEQMLWRAVVIQALKDAKNSKFSKNKRMKIHRWFHEEKLDFECVCFWADVDANAVRKKFLRIKK